MKGKRQYKKKGNLHGEGVKMPDDTFKAQVRKKILEMKHDNVRFWTETFNLVTVLLRLNPEDELDPIRDRMIVLYRQPDKRFPLKLSQLERLYNRYKDDPNLKLRGITIDNDDIQSILDKARQDLLFYLALIEDKPRDYGILLKTGGN